MRINKIHILKTDVSRKCWFNRLPDILNGRFGFQKFIESFLGSRSPLDHTGDPSDGADRERQHRNINDEFGDRAQIRLVCAMDHIETANHDRQQRAQTDDQAHGREINGFHFGEADGIFPIFFAVGMKKRSMADSCTKDLITRIPL